MALSIAAVAVVAIVAGVVAIATSGDGRSAAASVAPDRSSAIEAGDPPPPVAHEPRAGSTLPPEALCEAACRSGCGLEGPDCARFCLEDPRTVRCLEEVGPNDCAAWSRCFLGASCSGEPPRGDASCGATYACERSCRDNIACSCSCLGRMAPVHSLAMTRLSMCALFMCANDAACVQSSCKAQLEACEAR